MAKVQYSYVERKKSLTGQTGTETFDLPELGFIPEIVIRVFSTPTATTDPALPINDAITKIEIVDGGTTIWSVTGNQAHGIECFFKKRRRASTEKNDNAVEGYDEFSIPLGMMINGVNYAPDFSKFANPQLKLTWDYALTTTQFGMIADADTAPAMKVTIIAKIVRDGGKYSHGYMKANQIYTFTQATSTTTQTEIPRGEMLYGLMIEAGYMARDWTEDVEEVKLDFNNGDWIPFHFREEEIAKSQEEWFKEPFEVKFRADAKDGKALDVHMGYVTDINAVPIEYISTGGHISFTYPSNTQGIGNIKILSGGIALAQYQQFMFTVQGFMPYQCWLVPMSQILDGQGDLIDTKAYSRIILETLSGSTALTASTPAIVGLFFVK